MLSGVILSKMKDKWNAWAEEVTEKCWCRKTCRLTLYYVFQMTFISSDVPSSRRGITFVLYSPILYHIVGECHLYNTVIDYTGKEAPSRFEHTLQLVMVRKGSFARQLMLWQMQSRVAGEEGRLLSLLCRKNWDTEVAAVGELHMWFD